MLFTIEPPCSPLKRKRNDNISGTAKLQKLSDIFQKSLSVSREKQDSVESLTDVSMLLTSYYMSTLSLLHPTI